MRYRLHLTAYDIADKVAVTWRLLDDEKAGDEGYYEVLERRDTLTGVGESDPKAWMRRIAQSILDNS